MATFLQEFLQFDDIILACHREDIHVVGHHLIFANLEKEVTKKGNPALLAWLHTWLPLAEEGKYPDHCWTCWDVALWHQMLV